MFITCALIRFRCIDAERELLVFTISRAELLNKVLVNSFYLLLLVHAAGPVTNVYLSSFYD